MSKVYYEGVMKWVIYGICVTSLFCVLAATYLIVRVVDGDWTNWRLPVILAIVFLVVVPISAMFTALSDIKRELDKVNKVVDKD